MGDLGRSWEQVEFSFIFQNPPRELQLRYCNMDRGANPEPIFAPDKPQTCLLAAPPANWLQWWIDGPGGLEKQIGCNGGLVHWKVEARSLVALKGRQIFTYRHIVNKKYL